MLAKRRGNRQVGLVWNGNPEHVCDRRRPVPVDQLEPLWNVPGVDYFALSPGRSETIAQWQARSMSTALLAKQDLMVAIGSAPAHLGGRARYNQPV